MYSIRFRDVAQLHYKRFEKRPRNYIDAKTVFEHIGPFIRVLAANFYTTPIGSNVGKSITKYCVNVKSLKIFGEGFTQPYNTYTTYSDWLRALTRISLSIQDLLLIDLSETTTLEELRIFRYKYDYYFTPDFGRVADIFGRNGNIRSLHIPLTNGFQYEIFEKLKCLKRLVLDITHYGRRGALVKVAAKLKMTALEQVEVIIGPHFPVVELNEFLRKLNENALHLKDLSIADKNFTLDINPLSSVQFPNPTSLRLMTKYPHLYKEIPKLQPNLKHLNLAMYDDSDLQHTWIFFT